MSRVGSEDSGAARATGPRGVLRHRAFRTLIGATAISEVGDLLYTVGLVVYVFDQTGSTGWVAVAAMARTLAYVMLSPVAGAVGDRVDKRRLLIGESLAAFAVMVALTLLTAGQAPVAIVIAFAVIASALGSFNVPAVFALIPTYVGEDDLAPANAAFATVEQASVLVGPAIGAALVATVSVPATFAVNGLTFVVAAGLFVFLPRERVAPDSPETDPTDPTHSTDSTDPIDADGSEGMWGQLREGIRAIRESPAAAFVLAIVFASLVVYGFEMVLYVEVADALLGTGSEGVGYLTMAAGAGGIAASLVSSRLAAGRHIALTLGLTLAVSGLPMAALAVVRQPVVAYALIALAGACFVWFEVLTTTILQRAVPASVLGRVFGMMMSICAAATFAGALASPVLVSLVGLPTTLAIGGTSLVVVAILCGPRLRRLGAASLETQDALAPRVAVLAGLGLFDGASLAALELVAAAVVPADVPAGTEVLRAGDEPDDLYVVRTGTLDVFSQRPDPATGRPALVNTMESGDWFGEIGLVAQVPRTATVVATTDCELWRIPGPIFLEAVEALAGIANPMRMTMTSRLARTH